MSCAVISGRQVLLSFDVARCARVANMQVITAIYLNCRPDLRDEWLTGIEVERIRPNPPNPSTKAFKELMSIFVVGESTTLRC